MTEAELRTAIIAALHAVAPDRDPAALDPQASIREALELDSFDVLTALTALSRTTGVSVPEADYGQLGTIEAMVRYFQARQARARSDGPTGS